MSRRTGPIEEIYAYLAREAGGAEGIAGFRDERGYWVPMLMTDGETARQLRQRAQHIADLTEASVELCRFSNRERIEVLLPLPVEASVVGTVEEADTHHIPFEQMAPTVRPSSEMIPAVGQVIHAIISDGKPGIAIEYFTSGGQKLPPITVMGEPAADLLRMGRQAYDSAVDELAKGKQAPDA